MTSVVSDLLGKRVEVHLRRDYDERSQPWMRVAEGRVRGVAQREGGSFVLLLEVEAHPGGDTTGLWYLGHSELPHRALISVSTAPGKYAGTVAIIVSEAP